MHSIDVGNLMPKNESCQDAVRVLIGQSGLWCSKDGDYPVTITGDLGLGSDGRRYVSVRFVSTGIPLDEIELSDVSS